MSIAIAVGGQLFRIGRIPANSAFVVVRGNLRLLYVATTYRNYRYAARRVFDGFKHENDIDHVLGKNLAQSHGFSYTLVACLDRKVNRSHGSWERPLGKSGYVNLSKDCYTDQRILEKVLGTSASLLSSDGRTRGYELKRHQTIGLTDKKARLARGALGMKGLTLSLVGLRPIER